jgi:hypothetical protein
MTRSPGNGEGWGALGTAAASVVWPNRGCGESILTCRKTIERSLL